MMHSEKIGIAAALAFCSAALGYSEITCYYGKCAFTKFGSQRSFQMPLLILALLVFVGACAFIIKNANPPAKGD